jgi:hypothetical protein
VTSERRTQLWCLIVDHAHGNPVEVAHVGATAISTVGVDGAALTVTLAASPRETIYANDPLASELEELTLTVGEGPGIDARTGGPALAADLSSAECEIRWPVFAPAAVDAGAQAFFALPLQVGSVHLGVMDLYRIRPGPLNAGELADALILADTACAVLLDLRTHGLAGNGPPEGTGPEHPEVHQATGMLIVQLGATATVALIRLRAYAYAHDRRLHDVAADVVARRLRFTAETDERETGPDQ